MLNNREPAHTIFTHMPQGPGETSPMNDVLLVRTDHEMQLVTLLSRAGFYVQLADSTDEALKALSRHRPAVVIIGDVPDLASTQWLLTRLRAHFNAAIITLGRRDTYTRALAVEYGSDLYLDESVGDAELIARIHSLVRRYQRQPGPDASPESTRGSAPPTNTSGSGPEQERQRGER